MKQTALTLLTTLLVGTAFAASHTGAPMPEAMKPGNTQAEDAAQKNTDEKAKLGAAPSGPMPEAMKPGNEKAEDAAQKNTDEKAKLGAPPSGPMPEAMKPGNEKSEAAAEENAKPKVGKKNSTDEQMSNDAKKQ